MTEKLDNTTATKELCKEYNWYQDTFSNVIQNSCDEFFGEYFKLNLIAISQNINYLLDKEPCFVTKARINKDYEVFFRLTDKAVKLILDKSLGELKHKFDLNKISELESKVITSFNSNLYKALKKNINEPNPKELKRKNYDITHLTFLIEDCDKLNKNSGKIVVTIPRTLLTPDEITSSGEKFTEDDFRETETFAKIKIGSTKFSLYNLKNLETDDIVVFDNSNIENLTIEIQGEDKNFTINPNMELLISEDINEGDNNMTDNQNIWDNIEVEIKAELDAVKITLGELKDIENGLVIDLASLYDNNVTLKVEGRAVATGSLVIVNDRYGVKITDVITPSESNSETFEDTDEEKEISQQNQESEDNDEEYDENEDLEENYDENENSEEDNEEFDYSDFELEDENI